MNKRILLATMKEGAQKHGNTENVFPRPLATVASERSEAEILFDTTRS